MSLVNIAEFRRRIAEYLRRVRNGEPVTIADRDTPIAIVRPYRETEDDLSTRPPRRGYAGIRNVKAIRRRKGGPKVDSLAALAEDRSRG